MDPFLDISDLNKRQDANLSRIQCRYILSVFLRAALYTWAGIGIGTLIAKILYS